MDAKTVLLTANTETVYALSHLDVKADGPTVVEAPPHMLLHPGRLAALSDRRRSTRAGQGCGWKFLILPPGYTGIVPEGYFVFRSPTYSVTVGLERFSGR
jgi:hypothetical protein